MSGFYPELQQRYANPEGFQKQANLKNSVPTLINGEKSTLSYWHKCLPDYPINMHLGVEKKQSSVL
ncbi:hypothetical protein SAMN04488522_1084 [Pedobacter caeni]|uniref:Uncharacterized protein n=1 Tax=Pedobacter caeni TaxID=288992 RepID=A0A1M5N6C1_9SPHI|nr:hypothetical protein SAMN04488522_1084 [Pedobacter caeni]